MSLKLLVAAALAATNVTGDLAFDVSINADEATRALKKVQEYMDQAPKSATELADGCMQYLCKARYVDLCAPRYFFSRAELERVLRDAFAAGAVHGVAGHVPVKDAQDVYADLYPGYTQQKNFNKQAVYANANTKNVAGAPRETGKSPLLGEGYTGTKACETSYAGNGPVPAAVGGSDSAAVGKTISMYFPDGTNILLKVK